MARVQTIGLAHLPAHPVHVALFDHVTNAAALRQHLLSGNPEFEYAFLDATTILSTSHLLAAVFRALNDLLNARLKSRNVHSEIVFSLSPNNNIAESFRRFGIQDATTTLLAIKVSTPSSPVTAEAVQAHLSTAIEGTPLELTDAELARFTDLARIRKIYKLDSAKPMDGTADEPVDERKDMEAVVLGTMALKGS
ncbi:uncharacterized protein K452DRAFT_277286 [Aplosporella prunicola CBS 121167]|uniref:EKC/KEOPS complex subunit CGI121 n=1 Tax=Aplosporella prunicola CBS 121167 TaxID=1176127 RepID=A0A6A6B652_9PEZI|nr:uncharacterized protein K452DRAFT_277286 [Aplosporella prunicola CBS 121167]KAF2138261.1 hypothetical protein K452DRAFT_277286 [Aplosporella prunicola CBS 121167]